MVPLIDNGAFAIPDEALYAAQADNLAMGSWSRPRPSASLDQDGDWFVLSGSIIVGNDAIPYARRPMYPFVSTPFWSVGGNAGLLLLSVLGTWMAACGAAALGWSLNQRTSIPALWLVGLGTPLLFDAYLAFGHSLAAGFAALTALGVVRSQLVEPPYSRRWVAWVTMAAAGAVAATMLRSEGVLYAASLAGALLVLAVFGRQRSTRQRQADATTGAILLAIGAASYNLNDVWSKAIVRGATGDPTLSDRHPDFLNAAWTGLLRPWYPDNTKANAPMALVLLAAVSAPLIIRFLPKFRVLGIGLLALGATSAVWFAASSPHLISGLLPTAPWLVVGMLSLRGRDLSGPGPAAILLGSSAFIVGVLATSYGFGGAAEWGGRFFHLALPAVAPIAILGLISLLDSLPRIDGRVCLVAIAVMTAGLSATALRANHQLRVGSEQIANTITTAALDTPEASATVFATLGADGTSRILWRQSSQHRPLLNSDGLINLAPLLTGLPPSATQVAVVTNSSDESRLDPLLKGMSGSDWKVARHRVYPAAGLAVFTVVRD